MGGAIQLSEFSEVATMGVDSRSAGYGNRSALRNKDESYLRVYLRVRESRKIVDDEPGRPHGGSPVYKPADVGPLGEIMGRDARASMQPSTFGSSIALAAILDVSSLLATVSLNISVNFVPLPPKNW